jgi:hypothetical protein
MGAVGGLGDSFVYGGLTLEVGVTVLREPVPLRVRGFAGFGGSMQGQGDGTLVRAGIGVEPRWCQKRNRLCGFAGVDLGYHAFTDDMFETEPGVMSRGPFAGPRLGFEAGGPLRVRVALEYYRQLTSGSADQSIGVELGFAFQR